MLYTVYRDSSRDYSYDKARPSQAGHSIKRSSSRCYLRARLSNKARIILQHKLLGHQCACACASSHPRECQEAPSPGSRNLSQSNQERKFSDRKSIMPPNGGYARAVAVSYPLPCPFHNAIRRCSARSVSCCQPRWALSSRRIGAFAQSILALGK